MNDKVDSGDYSTSAGREQDYLEKLQKIKEILDSFEWGHPEISRMKEFVKDIPDREQ